MKTLGAFGMLFIFSVTLSTGTPGFAQSQPTRESTSAKDATKVPTNIRLCVGGSLYLRLAFVGNHYIGRLESNNAAIAEYYILEWTPTNVHLFGKGLFPDKNGVIVEAEFTGTMAADGVSVTDGQAKWTKGNSGGFTFTLQWSDAPGNITTVKRLVAGNRNSPLISTVIEVIDTSKVKVEPVYGELPWTMSDAHPDLVVPPLAAPEYALLPDDYRAILRPGPASKLMTVDALKASCSEAKSEKDPAKALEIGKFAVRDLEYDRGVCWVNRAYELGNPGAPPLIGVFQMEGWGGTKDPVAAFRTFSVRNGSWSLYFREQCLLRGVGTEKNEAEAKKLDLKIQMGLEGEYMLAMIGLDKVENQRHAFESQLMLHPPTKPRVNCRKAFPNEMIRDDERGPDRTVCKTSYDVDRDAVKEALDNWKPGEPQVCTTDLMGLQTCM